MSRTAFTWLTEVLFNVVVVDVDGGFGGVSVLVSMLLFCVVTVEFVGDMCCVSLSNSVIVVEAS